MYNDKTLKSVAEAVKKVMEAELSTKQKAIAKMSEPKHKIDSGDLSKLRAGHKPVKEAVVKGKGYDNPENERKAPEGHAPMTSLMPGHDERAAKFLARQAKGTLVKGKAGSAPQKEPEMKKEEVEQVDEAQSHQAKTTMKHIKNPTKGEIEASKHMKSGIAGYADRIAMLKSAEARGALKNEEVKIEESDDLGPVKKKQKTVMLVHKTSGREKVIHDTPENRKKNAELGFHPVKEEVEINEMDKSQPSSSRGAEGLPVGKVAKPISYDKVKKDAYGKLKPLLNKKYKKVKEEVEQIDELKISTLARYATKANQALIGGDRSKEDKRIKGIKTAQYKILKQRANKIKEEVEELDEAVALSDAKTTAERLVKKTIATHGIANPRTASDHAKNAHAIEKTLDRASVARSPIHLAHAHSDVKSVTAATRRHNVALNMSGAERKAHKALQSGVVKHLQQHLDQHKQAFQNAAAKYASKNKTNEEVEQMDEMWPGTPEYKKKFPDTERTTGRGERHDIEKTSTGVKATRRYSTDDTTEKPANAPKRGRGRPKKDKFAEAVDFLMSVNEDQFEELIAEGFDAFFAAYERAVTK